MSKLFNQDDLLNRAKEYALKCISYRPRSAWEMNKKLADKGYDEDIITLVMIFLKEYNFIDDEAFAGMWLRSRNTCKPSGRRRIYAELAQKRLDKEIIEKCLSELTAEKEEEMAWALVEKKCRKIPFDYNKLKGFLIRRGFGLTIINKVLLKYQRDRLDKIP